MMTTNKESKKVSIQLLFTINSNDMMNNGSEEDIYLWLIIIPNLIPPKHDGSR